MKSMPVVLTRRALQDLQEIGDYIAARSPLNAQRFMAKLEREILALEDYGTTLALAPEAKLFSFPLKQLVVRPYRVLFRVTDRAIEILHIRHGRRVRSQPDSFGNPA